MLPFVVVMAVLLAFSSPAAAQGIGGYAGDRPLTIYDNQTINGGLVYETVTNGSGYTLLYATELYPLIGYLENLTQNITIRSCVDELDTNCIPAGATVKMARLYNYYCWSSPDNDVADMPGMPAEANMWFTNASETQEKVCVYGLGDGNRGSLPNPINSTSWSSYPEDVEHYWDTKGQNYSSTTWDYPSGAFAWDVTEMVTGNGTFVAKIENNDTTPTGFRPGFSYPSQNRERFCTFGFGLLVVYEQPSSPQIEYGIAEGCDSLLGWCSANPFESWENATASATFGGISSAANANLTTVLTCSDGGVATPPRNMMCFNCPTSCLDCIGPGNPSECCIGPSTAGGIEHIGVDYFDVTSLISSTQNVLEFQDRGDCEYVHNAFLVVSSVINVLHVASIDISLSDRTAGKNTFTRATAVVTIVDAAGIAVEGATVYGTWSNATSDTDSGVTNANGQVSLESNEVKNAKSGTTFTFTVDNVELTGWTYDPSANNETSDSKSVP